MARKSPTVERIAKRASFVAGFAAVIQLCDDIEDRREFIAVLRDRNIIPDDVAEVLFDELCMGVH